MGSPHMTLRIHTRVHRIGIETPDTDKVEESAIEGETQEEETESEIIPSEPEEPAPPEYPQYYWPGYGPGEEPESDWEYIEGIMIKGEPTEEDEEINRWIIRRLDIQIWLTTFCIAGLLVFMFFWSLRSYFTLP